MWNQILTAAELNTYHADTAKLDPAFARKEREWYQSRTLPQLAALIAQAWYSNDSTSYMMARSYAALLTAR